MQTLTVQTWTIEDLLVGKLYTSGSRNFTGEIVSAEPHQYLEGAYVIRVRESGFPSYHYATIYVEVA